MNFNTEVLVITEWMSIYVTFPTPYTQIDEKYAQNVYLTENCMVYNPPEITEINHRNMYI